MSGLRLFNLGGSEIRTDGNIDTMDEMTSIGVSEINSINNTGITISSGTSILFDTGGNESMIIMPGGSVGIGKSTPEFDLDISNTGHIRTGSANFFNVNQRIDTSSNRLNFHTIEQYAFFAAGNTTPVIGIYQQYVSINTSGYIQNAHVLNVVGSAGKTTGTAWVNTSDDRIKYNEVLISGPSALDAIKQLNPQTYEKIIETPPGASGNWIPTDAEWPSVKDNYNWHNEIGVIAQNVRNIPGLSLAVIGQEVDAEGTQKPLWINWDYIHNYHIAATKELSSQLEAEKIKVANLTSRLEALENA